MTWIENITVSFPPQSYDCEFPEMYGVHQKANVPAPVDVPAKLNEEWEKIKNQISIAPGDRIAIGVGSRGIKNLAEVVRGVVKKLKESGADPFVIPAMGSHGGATALGQKEVLGQRGVTQETVGAPVEAVMDVVCLGETDGIPLYMDRLAHEADGFVLVNRIKPHTEFTGPVESGIIKMLCIGLGNQKGANLYHKMALSRGLYDIIITAGRQLLQKTKLLFGLALVENQHHLICDLKMATTREIESCEKQLLKDARGFLPSLPLDEIDLLIVDEIGKDISGAGMDPNVVGGKGSCIWSSDRRLPEITRIFVRDLTATTKGHAPDLARIHVTTPKLLEKVDMQATAVNSFTAFCPESFKIPMTLPTEKQAVLCALSTIRLYTMEDLRVVHIKNTLALDHLRVSKGCLPGLKNRSGLFIDPEGEALAFDESGNLISKII